MLHIVVSFLASIIGAIYGIGGGLKEDNAKMLAGVKEIAEDSSHQHVSKEILDSIQKNI